jgi:hypothetical protein
MVAPSLYACCSLYGSVPFLLQVLLLPWVQDHDFVRMADNVLEYVELVHGYCDFERPVPRDCEWWQCRPDALAALPRTDLTLPAAAGREVPDDNWLMGEVCCCGPALHGPCLSICCVLPSRA